jgi:hypothetical protein
MAFLSLFLLTILSVGSAAAEGALAVGVVPRSTDDKLVARQQSCYDNNNDCTPDYFVCNYEPNDTGAFCGDFVKGFYANWNPNLPYFMVGKGWTTFPSWQVI